MFNSLLARVPGTFLAAVTLVAALMATGTATPARAATLYCDGGLKVWSQPSGSRFLIFFQNTGKFRKVTFDHNFGYRGRLALLRGHTAQIHADRTNGSIDCL